MENINHPLKPIYDKNSKILILGTMPSPKSREVHFYYGHPQNRFWSVLGDIYGVSFESKEDKVKFLLDNHLALWDVIASCKIEGASDSSIKDVIPNDIGTLVRKSNIQFIFTTGKKADALYQKYIYPKTQIQSICLPSTSPANRTISYDKIKQAYTQIKEVQGSQEGL